jgi:hypothetical protein
MLGRLEKWKKREENENLGREQRNISLRQV